MKNLLLMLLTLTLITVYFSAIFFRFAMDTSSAKTMSAPPTVSQLPVHNKIVAIDADVELNQLRNEVGRLKTQLSQLKSALNQANDRAMAVTQFKQNDLSRIHHYSAKMVEPKWFNNWQGARWKI